MKVKMYPSNNSVRITVIKKLHHMDLIEKYTDTGDWPACQHFEVGQSFIAAATDPWTMPEGFCGWAWADIQKIVWGMARGGPNLFVTCCTDGFRPVLFKLEKIGTEKQRPEGTT